MMKRRTALMVSAMLTAFVLVIVGGLVANLSQPTGTSTQMTAVAVPATWSQESASAPTEPVDAPAPITAADTGTISREQACQAAIAYRGGGTVTEVELEQARGMQVYEVEFGDGGEVSVDAATGEVVTAELQHYDEAAEERHHDDERERAECEHDDDDE